MMSKKTNLENLENAVLEQELAPDELEFMKSLDHPVGIRISCRHYKDGNNSAAILYPYIDVKREVEAFNDEHCEEKINYSLMKRINSSLFNKLVTWSNLIDGSSTPKTALKDMGFITWDKTDAGSFKNAITKFFTEDMIMEFYDKGHPVKELHTRIKNADKEINFALSSKKYFFKKGISIANIIDDSYPGIKERTGILPSEIMGLRPWHYDTIKNIANELYYSGEDLREHKVANSFIGGRLVYYVRHPNNTSLIPRGKRNKLKVGYGINLPKFFDFEKCKTGHLLTAPGANTQIAKIMEYDFAFLMTVIQKLDPQMKNMPDMKDFFKAPIQKIYDPRITHHKKTSNSKESDLRLEAGGESYLIEHKRADYLNKRAFYKSIGKYSNIKKWNDGTSIDNKILFINDINGYSDGIAKIIGNDEWKIITGEQNHEWYIKMLDMLSSTDFNKTCPLNEHIEEISRLIHLDSHILARTGNRNFRKLLFELMKRNIRHMNGEEIFTDVSKYDFEYQIRLSDIKEIYSLDLKGIDEKYVFWDAESTGLSRDESQMLMSSLGYVKNGEFIIRILFARTPLEERRLINETIEEFKKHEVVMTFNGIPYDKPLLEARAFVNRIALPKFEFGDLYLEFFKGYSKSNNYAYSKLKFLEKTELGIDRRGDVESANIPEYYNNYLLAIKDHSIMKIISHNVLDLASMPFFLMKYKGYEVNQLPRQAVSDYILSKIHINNAQSVNS